jgi:transglutaminase-like putative cysteine protease
VTPTTVGYRLSGPGGHHGAKRLRAGADLAVTGALCAVALVAGAGFARVCTGTSWAVPVTGTVTVACVVTFAVRQLRVRATAATLFGLLAVFVTAPELAMRQPHVGFQLLGTMTAAMGALRAGAAASFVPDAGSVQALAGFVLLSAWAAGVALVCADCLAFRLRSLGALVPLTLLFLVTCVLGTSTGRTWALATFVAAAVLFAFVHQWALVDATTRRAAGAGGAKPVFRWLAWPVGHARTTRGPYPMARAGLAFVAATVVAGVACVLPLNGEVPGFVAWRRSFEVAVRVAPDPWVSLQGDLLQSPHTPLFIVHSTSPAYWRLTSLQDFDGTQWTGSGSYQQVHVRLPGPAGQPGAQRVVEKFEIEKLGSPWLPVAFRPETISSGTMVSYDPSSGSLLSRNPTADGQTYKVVAEEDLALFSPALLSRSRPITRGERAGLAPFMTVPRGLPAGIAQFSRKLLPTTASEYQKAEALQDFFRRAPFRYSLPTSGAHINSINLASFLFQTHSGYCQQYATAYAILARLAGVPARVAVGFTTGAPLGPGEWQVLGMDAHAWPEVWFPSFGWVPFEPTPTFAIPRATRNTAASGNAWNVQPRRGGPNKVLPSLSACARTGCAHPGGPPEKPAAVVGVPSWRSALKITLGAFAALSLWAALLRAGWQLRWWRRRIRLVQGGPAGARGIVLWQRKRPDGGGSQRPDFGETERAYGWLLLAWERLSEDLGLLGLARWPHETPAEWVLRARKALAIWGALDYVQQNALVEVGEALSRAAYGTWRPAADELCHILAAADENRRRARATVRWRGRALRYLDPRVARGSTTFSPKSS